jgi:hypothetical protein
MKKYCAVVAVAGLLLAACGDSSKDAGGSGSGAKLEANCKSAGAAYGKVLGEAFAKQNPEKKEALQVVQDSVVASCEADKWPSSALSCLTATRTSNQMEACINSLPPDVQKKMEDAAVAKLKAAK